jgi:RNA polymerase sigma-70 factor (ECF subfamily)
VTSANRRQRSTLWARLLARPQAAPDDAALVAALRAGDEAAFARIVDEWSGSMRRVALTFVRSREVADEVVQEAWLGVLRGLGRFEGRSSLKTWVFRILANVAKTRGEREARTVPFSSFEPAGDEASVDPDRFSSLTGAWSDPPASWRAVPEERLLSAETRAVIDRAIEALPPAQRIVITLRDVQGFNAGDVCNVLDVSETNQRVLLHRARSKVRAAIEEYLHEDR